MPVPNLLAGPDSAAPLESEWAESERRRLGLTPEQWEDTTIDEDWLTEPVQLCDSCAHNTVRSGWEPVR